jgi:hypothetical protein
MHPHASGTVSSRNRAGLPADADLNQDEICPFDGTVELAGQLQRAAVAGPTEHPRASPPTTSSRSGVDVVEPQLVDLHLDRPETSSGVYVDPRTNNRELHPFTPVNVTPSTKTFCARKKMTITGAMTRSVAAMVRFHCT